MDWILGLLKPYKLYLLIACGLLVMAATWRVLDWRNDAHLLSAEKLAHSRDNAKCESDKLLTKGANDALQTDRDRIAAKLAGLKRLHPERCVPVVASPAKLTISAGGFSGAHGVASGALRDFAADCNITRSERIVLEKFLVDERK